MTYSWSQFIQDESTKPYFQSLLSRLNETAQQGAVIYPPQDQVYRAFELTPWDQVKVVIVGQDPYHSPDTAHGLAFSAQKGRPIPPSLRNIYQELSQDIEGFQIPHHADLSEWAAQGVLLLNTVLTVYAGQANSHAGWGWEQFTRQAIDHLNHHASHLVFLLWGRQAGALKIDEQRHLVLRSAHPSPLSAYRGFFGSRPFSRANAYLQQHGKVPIDWQIHA